jgi:hypothetical protein
MTEWEAVAARLRRQWASIPGLVDVRIRRRKDGVAVVCVRSRGPTFPKGLPATVPARVGITSLILPVMWAPVADAPPVEVPQHHDIPITDAMWGGAPPVHTRMLTEYPPQLHRPPYPTGELPPPVNTHEFQLFVNARDPKLPFWSRPFDMLQCRCLDHIGVPTLILTFPIPADQMLTLTGISYNVFGAAVYDRLRISVSRNLNEQATWDDMVMSAAADDAHQFAFAGHEVPLPLNVIADHDQSIEVTVTALGGPPYAPIPAPADLQVCVLLRGWISTVNDTRDGAPKSYDLGAISEIAFGNLDVVSDFTDADLAAAVQRVVDENAAETGVSP